MNDLKHEFTWKLAAPPARVFAALTEVGELEAWFAEHVEVEPRIGGAYRFWGKHTYDAPSRAHATQKITRFEPGRSIAYTWRIHDRDSEVSLVVGAEAENADASVLTGEHAFAQAPAINRAREMVDDLWRLNWGNLSAHLAGGQGKLLPDYSSDKTSIELSIYIDAPPSAVFRALINPEKVQAWFGVPAAVDARVGGTWHLKMPVGKEMQEAPPLDILEFVENERLAISWPDWRGDKDVPSQRVRWILKAEGNGTRVEFTHDGFVRVVDMSDYPFGWSYFLSRITQVAEGKTPAPAEFTEACG
jgi:uncharacterized protein YndB with AHSA1/START domain